MNPATGFVRRCGPAPLRAYALSKGDMGRGLRRRRRAGRLGSLRGEVAVLFWEQRGGRIGISRVCWGGLLRRQEAVGLVESGGRGESLAPEALGRGWAGRKFYYWYKEVSSSWSAVSWYRCACRSWQGCPFLWLRSWWGSEHYKTAGGLPGSAVELEAEVHVAFFIRCVPACRGGTSHWCSPPLDPDY